MKKIAPTEEFSRLLVAAAALDVAGRKDRTFILGSVTPESSRIYLFAVPADAPGGDRFSADMLASELREKDIPHGMDWRRGSPKRGLRYVPSYVRLSEGMRKFSGQEAEAAWSAWSIEQAEMKRAVRDVAVVLSADPRADLDLLEALGVEGGRDATTGLRRTGGRPRADDARS